MEYNDDALITTELYEKMAKAYRDSIKEKGFVFFNLDDTNLNMIIDDVFEIFHQLKASYKYLGCFFDSHIMLELTNDHIDKLNTLFKNKEKYCFYVTGFNKTKSFINSIALENALATKLILLAQKCEHGKELMEMILERTNLISKNLSIPYIMHKKSF